MKNINYNPYRIIGIIANATAREIQVRKGKIQAFSRVGKDVTSEYDFPFLKPIQRDSKTIDKAFSDIEHDQDKVIHALFWFINITTIDNAVLQYLTNGNIEKAINMWENIVRTDVTTSSTIGETTSDINVQLKEITLKNFSAFNNLGTIYLTDKNKIKAGIEIKLKLIESDFFKDFVTKVADETFVINEQKIIEIFVDEVIKFLYKESYNSIQILSLFKNTGSAKNYITEKLTEEPIHNIEKAVENSKQQRVKDKSSAHNIGNKLYNDTQITLNELKQILGVNNLRYQAIADGVAKELKQCAVENWNNSKERGDEDLKNSIEITNLAYKIAIGKNLKEEIQKDIKTLEEMKDRELNKAIEVLEMVKKTYHNVPYGSTLNWYKVSEIIIELIPRHSVFKIKNSTNTLKQEQYKTLVEFIISRSNGYYKLTYLRYWSNQASWTSPKPNSGDSNDGCVWIIIVLGVLFLLMKIFSS